MTGAKEMLTQEQQAIADAEFEAQERIRFEQTLYIENLNPLKNEQDKKDHGK